MSYSRRDFIKFGSFAIGFLPAFAGRGFGRAVPDALSFLNFGSFQKLIGTQFTFYRSDSASAAVLTEVSSFEISRKKTGGECYSLVFEMPSDDFAQEKYEMFHPSFGRFELFSVPGKSEKGTPLLIAVINRV